MPEVPLPVRVAADLRQKIEDGLYQTGQKLPSERDLADQAGVSRQVVRQAIADLCRLGVLDCQPRCRPIVITGASAKPIKRKRDAKIYLAVFPHVSDIIASQLLKGVQQGLTDPDVDLAMSPVPVGRMSSGHESERQQLLSIASDPHASGLILWYIGAERNIGALQVVRDAKIPMVFVDREPPKGFDADYVGTDNHESARLAVQHLISLGHRRIAMLTNEEPVSSVEERESGYHAALTDAGINIDPDLMITVYLEGQSFEQAVRSAIETALALPDSPTAIFAVNDQIALRTHSTLLEMGVAIPGQISVVGFDGWLRSIPGGGNLTSAAQQFERIGHLAVKTLQERIHFGTPKSYRHVILEAPLLLKGSTGPVRAQQG